ncbi:MAG TPA: PEP-CTERM sorting domain-containing protein [Verrucomicrobiae bacterium]|nr:PEP-CTERM sorting domain-containing protein [Verrucomicrobiae bacterium]
MKTRTFVLLVLVGFTSTLSQAGFVTGVTSDFGDANVYCPIYTFSAPDQSLSFGDAGLPVNQYGAGAIAGNFTTVGDPTLTLANTINNNTGSPWTGYIVDVSMGQTFTIGGLSVANPGWSIAVAFQPVLVGGPFIGEIHLTAGTPVQDGQLLSFQYDITFAGSTSFSETLTPVPEPSSMSLLAGALLLGGFAAMKSRRAIA